MISMSSFDMHEQIVLKGLAAHPKAAKFNGCRGVVVETSEKYMRSDMRTVLVLPDDSDKAVRMTLKTKYLAPYDDIEDEMGPESVIFETRVEARFGCAIDKLDYSNEYGGPEAGQENVEKAKAKIKGWEDSKNMTKLEEAKAAMDKKWEDMFIEEHFWGTAKNAAEKELGLLDDAWNKHALKGNVSDKVADFKWKITWAKFVPTQTAETYHKEIERLEEFKEEAHAQNYWYGQRRIACRTLVLEIENAIIRLNRGPGPLDKIGASIMGFIAKRSNKSDE